MKIFGTFLFFVLFSISAFAQKNLSLTGKLIDKADSSAVISASVELLNFRDSVYIAGINSDGKGGFLFKNLSSGDYILKISYIGYLPLYNNITLKSNKTTTDIGVLVMQTNDVLLKETVIEGKRPDVVVKNDTIEFDAASYKVQENAVVEDLLKKLPGVEVDKDGKVTVNGKEVKKFKLDGKEFFRDDPQIASKNLPAEMVEKLQVIDEKSEMSRMTGFDDGEEETIINLTIRPGMKKGTTGNALAGAGQDLNIDDDARYQAGAFLSNITNNDQYTLILGTNNNNNMGAGDLGANRFSGMRMRRGGGGGSGIANSNNFMFNSNKEFSKTLSLNGDLRFTGSDRLSESDVEQVRLSQITSRLDNTSTRTNYISNNIAANFRLEWKPDTMNTLIFRPNIGFNNSRSNETEYGTQFNYNTLDTISDSYGTAKTKGRGYDFGGALDYSRRFDKPGRVFSINLNAGYNTSFSTENNESETRRFTNNIYSHDVKIDQQAENDDKTTNYRATLSWVEPLGRNNFLQAIYRVSHRASESVNSTYDLDRLFNTVMRLDSLSRSTVRNSTEQRFGLNFKAVRAKYNYTLGFNIDPTSSTNNTYQPDDDLQLPYLNGERLTNILGDSLFSTIEQKVLNLSPVANFNYIFGQRSNLRINYEGETNQPSATQLRDYTDKSRPYNWSKGNPNLKPGYSNNLRVRFQKYVPQSQLMYNMNLNGKFSFNDIAAVTEMLGDSVRLTSYENINGNWNVGFFGTFNLPLKNKKFSVRNFSRVNYINQNTFVDKLENTQKSLTLGDNAGIDYRSELFDLGLNLSANYNKVSHTIRPENNQKTLSMGTGVNTTWYLPHNLTIESDINYTRRKGFENYDIPETMWNAAITKRLFSKKSGSGSLKLQFYDILQNRSNITSSATTDGYRISEVNVIPSYFMCSFIYKFTAFPKSSSVKEDDFRGGDRQWGPPPGGGGGGGRGPGGGMF
jgi:hypothetical protein